MNNFMPPQPGQTIIYMCTVCKLKFHHEIPRQIFGIIRKSVKCPQCKNPAVPDPAVKY